MTTRASQLRWILSAFAIILVADQISKAVVMATIDRDRALETEVFFQFTHQRNEGLVGGMFSGSPVLPFVLPVVATAVLLYLYRHLNPASRLQSVAYGFVFGGAIGNLIDRIRLGSVTDFLQFHFYFIPFDFPWKFYPAFNVADSAICVGVAVLILTWNVGSHPGRDAASTV